MSKTLRSQARIVPVRVRRRISNIARNAVVQMMAFCRTSDTRADSTENSPACLRTSIVNPYVDTLKSTADRGFPSTSAGSESAVVSTRSFRIGQSGPCMLFGKERLAARVRQNRGSTRSSTQHLGILMERPAPDSEACSQLSKRTIERRPYGHTSAFRQSVRVSVNDWQRESGIHRDQRCLCPGTVSGRVQRKDGETQRNAVVSWTSAKSC